MKPEKQDKEEPKDQQLDKKLPQPPEPQRSVEDKKHPPPVQASRSEPPPPPPPTAAQKSSSSRPEKSEKSQPSSSSSPAGSRKETRVRLTTPLSLSFHIPLILKLSKKVKLSRMRLRIAERLKQSQNTAASLTTFNEVDMSALIALRGKYKESILKSQDIKLGFMGLFARASILTLKEIPVANASIEGDEMVYRDYVDLSVAVATPKGLVTPVVRNAETMNVVEIEKEIAHLGKKARDGKLGLEDMNGGTFTM